MLDPARRPSLNGALFERDARVQTPDEAMSDVASGERLRERLEVLTGLRPDGV